MKEYTYYTSPSELLMALRTGKTDAFLNNTAIADLYVNQYDDVALFPEPLKEAVFGCGFSKNYKNLPEWERALAEIPADDIEAVWNKWTSADESKKIMPKQTWKGKAGKRRRFFHAPGGVFKRCSTCDCIKYRGKTEIYIRELMT